MEQKIDQLLKQAIFRHQHRQYTEAESIYRQILLADPRHADANHNLGLIAVSNKKHLEALDLFKSAIDSDPKVEQFWLSYITELNTTGNFGKVDQALKKAKKKGIPNKALKALKGKLVSARNMKDPASKLSYDKLEENLMSLLQSNRYKDAELLATSIIQEFPNRVFAWKTLGGLFNISGKKSESLDAFKNAVKLAPKDPESHRNLGALLVEAKNLSEGLESYQCAFALDPNYQDVLGWVIFCKQELCHWEGIPQDCDTLIEAVNHGKKVAHPFILNAVIDDTEVVAKAAQIFAQKEYPKSDALPPIDRYGTHKKIRIGYFSPDFREHPVAKGVVDLFQNHDRKKFEIHAFSLGAAVKDKWNTRVREGVDFFHELQDMSDKEIALLSRSLEIDIAVDLAGFTTKARTHIFAMSAAPIQLSYFGFLGTMGTNYYDYTISDPMLITEDNKRHYTENIIYLPSYQINSSVMEWSNDIFDKKFFDIPEHVIVFGSINNNYKITSDIFDSWARILIQVKESVLLLYINNVAAIDKLKIAMRNRNVDPDRLIFGERINGSEYWSRYKAIDILLDTFNCSGGSTSSDALRMGCPVLTRLGDTASSRFGGSLLTALELPELITTTQKDYEERAVELANNTKKLAALKEKLRSHVSKTKLFDAQQFTNSLEKAFNEIYSRHRSNKPAKDIYVD